MPVAAKDKNNFCQHLKLWCGHYSVSGREQRQQTAPQSCNWLGTSLHRYLSFLHRRVQAPDFSTTFAGRFCHWEYEKSWIFRTHVGTFTHRAQENTNLQWRHKACVIGDHVALWHREFFCPKSNAHRCGQFARNTPRPTGSLASPRFHRREE